MTGRLPIGSAPSGEDTSLDGTEKFPVSGSKYALISSIAAYIRTLTQTLTNKTIDLTSNTLTGTKAQFNTAMSDADFATIAGSETLTNKTLTAPTIADFTNAQHDHGDADDGGAIAAVGRTLISSQTPTGTGTVSFTSISGSYNKLTIEFLARGTAVAASVTMDIVFNSDTTDANYRQIGLGWYASTTVGAGAAGDNNIISDFIIASTGPATRATYGIIEIPFYDSTTFMKQVFYRSAKRLDVATNHEHGVIRVIEWESASAITQIDLILSSGNYDTGTTVNLYGES